MHSTLKLTLSFLVVTGIITLAGCAGMTSPPSCPDSTGLTCARVDQINTMIDRGQLGVTPIGQVPQGAAGPFHNFSASYPSSASSGEPIWNGEKVMQVWMAPYEDNAGNYHQASMINTVVKPGHWVGEEVKEITGMNE